MRVCLISFEYPPKIIGGIGTYAEHLVRGLNDRGIDVYVITRGDETSRDKKTYRILTPDTLYWRRFYFIKRAISLFNSLNKFCKFDLVHLNGTYPIIGSLRLPTVCTFHAAPNVKQMQMALQLKNFRSVKDITYLVLKTPVGSLFDLTIVKACDRIICPSPSLARDLVSYCFVDKEKIHVIPNGIDLKTFDETKCFDTSFLNDHDIQRDQFVLYIGRLSFLKGVKYLIEAFKSVQNQHPHLKLVIVGSGDSEPFLRRLTRDMKGILFLGHVDSMGVKKLLYEASFAVVLPSPVYEVSPMVVLEAMACSKPVVATNVGGNPFMIRHGKNGFLSRPRDSESLAKYVNVIYENRALGRKMGMFGKELVENKFSIDNMVNSTLKVYGSLS